MSEDELPKQEKESRFDDLALTIIAIILAVIAILTIVLEIFEYIDRKNSTSEYGKKFNVVVLNCVEGSFEYDPYYFALYQSAVKDNDIFASDYFYLAKKEGYQSYRISFSIDGKEYSVDRKISYEVGDTIEVLEVLHYYKGELENITYE